MPVDMAGYYPQSVKNIRAEMFESATDGAKNGIFLPELGSRQVRTGKSRFLSPDGVLPGKRSVLCRKFLTDRG